jgi:hypothetical protein
MGADSADAGSGQATLINCTITNNTAQGGNGGPGQPGGGSGDGGSGYGGAVFNLDGQVNLTNDTLDANNVVGGQGGPSVFLGGSTFGNSGFTGPSDGGEVYNLAFGNDIRSGSPVTASLILYNSILADSNGGTDLVNNTINGQGSNTASVTGLNNLVMVSVGDITSGVVTVTDDPQLGPLQDNGGPTFTMLPGPNSPVLGAGNPDLAPATDQRGVPRPPGGPTDLGSVQVSGTAFFGMTVEELESALSLVQDAVHMPNAPM